MINKSNLRDIIIAIVMLGSALFVFTHPAIKKSANEKINLAAFIPSAIKGWESYTYDTSNYKENEWQSINEILIRGYGKFENSVFIRKKVKRLNFILEYSSDLRKNFSFHFPEVCHRTSGNEIEFMKPIEVELAPDKILKAKCLYIHGEKKDNTEGDKIVAYWLVIDKKQYYQTFFIKLDQMLFGLLRQSKTGFLIRFDYYDNVNYNKESFERAKETISSFVKDLYDSLDENSRTMVFGK